MTKLVGYRDGVSKKSGKQYTCLYVLQDLTSFDKQNGSVGSKVDTIFAPDSLVGGFKPADIGKELLLDYDFGGGRAYLVNIVVK